MIEENGYLILRKAIQFDVADFIADEIRLLYTMSKNDKAYSDNTVPEAFSVYGSVPTEALMLKLWNIIEAEVGLELIPTYSYARYYSLGQMMPSHIDRPSCEYSITANLWNEKEPWPIWFLHPKGYPAQVDLNPGDIIIYKGCEITHWREKNTFGEVIQTFLHYVDVNGPNAEYAYDGRDLGDIDIWKRK